MALWAPQEGPQLDAIQASWCPELFFGGARGGGKSSFLLGDYAQDIYKYGRAWQGILFRRSYPELRDVLRQSYEIYPALDGQWYEQAKEWRFPNGAVLKFAYIENLNDATRYQGHSYAWIGWDELQQWPTLDQYHMLKATLRISSAKIERKRIRATGNPGGVGHAAIKDYFIDPAPQGYEPIYDDITNSERMFIPSRVTDNKILLKNDPQYINRLRGAGNEALVKMWLFGDWNVVTGAYFSEFSEKHILAPFGIPVHWAKYVSFDWGSYRPFAVQWWAVVGEDHISGVPRGSIICYREWYGSTGKPNEGIKLTAEEVAEGILSRMKSNEKVDKAVADPSIFKTDGGPSIAERIHKAGFKFLPADNSRISGWDQMRKRLVGEEDKPRIYWFKTCTNSIRTIPVMQHDKVKPEDLDSDLEDHCADAARYMCLSRPWLKDIKKPTEFKSIQNYTYDELLKEHDRQRRRREEG